MTALVITDALTRSAQEPGELTPQLFTPEFLTPGLAAAEIAQYVAKTGGGGPFSPTDYAGLLLWVDAQDSATLFQNRALTTPATTTGQPVNGWVDKSGEGNDLLSVAEFFYEGFLNTTALNGFPGVYSVGAPGAMDLRPTANLTLDSMTIFIVGKFDAASGIFYEQGNGPHGSPGSLLSGFQASRVSHGASGGGGYMSDYTASSATWFVTAGAMVMTQNYLRSPFTHQVMKDGALVASSSITEPTEANQAVTDVFKVGQRGGSGFPALGHYGEILVYSPGLTSEQITVVNDYLMGKWGI